MNHLFLHCRPGFEKECAAEITDLGVKLEIYGYSKAKESSAHVIFVTQEADGAEQLIKKLQFSELIFARQWFVCAPLLSDLSVTDRVTPLLEAAETLVECKELLIETVDTNDGKAMAGLGKKFTKPFMNALTKRRRLSEDSRYRMHLVFLTGTEAYIGYSPYANSAAWASGIPRMRLPRSAPSRATLKLEEAWHHFIPADAWDHRLGGGLRAVDLGAAPGGWTWQLVQRGMFVEAVDNGPMQEALMETGQVTHRESDGFLFEPKKPVHWMVCDIADKPARVSHLVTRWVGEGWCREAVFNLKLPMKQRYAEVQKCAARIESKLAEAGIEVELRFKQLYHDREEVTGHIRNLSY